MDERLARVAMAMYVNEPCRICGKNIEPHDLDSLVYAGCSVDGKSRCAHGDCWASRRKPKNKWAYPYDDMSSGYDAVVKSNGWMKVIIAGSRSITDRKYVDRAVAEFNFGIAEVVSGGANGVDLLGEAWAVDNNVPFTVFKPNWELYGKSAGLIRNTEMARYADALIAVWDGKSRGTKHMIKKARELGLEVFIYTVPSSQGEGK